jgi:hypothetical protein
LERRKQEEEAAAVEREKRRLKKEEEDRKKKEVNYRSFSHMPVCLCRLVYCCRSKSFRSSADVSSARRSKPSRQSSSASARKPRLRARLRWLPCRPPVRSVCARYSWLVNASPLVSFGLVDFSLARRRMPIGGIAPLRGPLPLSPQQLLPLRR